MLLQIGLFHLLKVTQLNLFFLCQRYRERLCHRILLLDKFFLISVHDLDLLLRIFYLLHNFEHCFLLHFLCQLLGQVGCLHLILLRPFYEHLQLTGFGRGSDAVRLLVLHLRTYL
jgi:hypothetical protein